MYRLAKISWNFHFIQCHMTLIFFILLPKQLIFICDDGLFLLTGLFEKTCTLIILRIFLVFCRQPPPPPPPRSAVWGRKGRQNIFSDERMAQRLLGCSAGMPGWSTKRLVAQWTGLILINSNFPTKVVTDCAAVSCPKPKIRKALEISKVWT